MFNLTVKKYSSIVINTIKVVHNKNHSYLKTVSLYCGISFAKRSLLDGESLPRR